MECQYQLLSGPGERELSAPEAARRALATLASAPAHTPGASPVSASVDPARAVDDRAAVTAPLQAYRPGPRAPNRDTWWPLASAVLVVVPACILALLYLSPLLPLSPPRPQICESLPILDPIVGGAPEGITAGPDGALWFTESQGNQIGRLTTSGQVSDFPLPPRITTSGHVREFYVPAVVSTPWGITAGPDGALWFTEYEANSIGRITTSGHVREVYVTKPSDSPTNALPRGITTGPDRALWFAEYGGNAIGRITTSGQLHDFPLPNR